MRFLFPPQKRPNPWKGIIIGALGGAAGVLAMSAYWQVTTSVLGRDPRKQQRPGPPMPLDNISLVGNNHYADESSTAALGRILYQSVTGSEPSQETKTLLSNLVHWGISLGVSGAYGAVREATRTENHPVEGGLAVGTTLWLLGDEVLMPLLGLTNGPTSYPPALHVHSLGAHVAYGVAAALVTEWLDTLST
jgi:hypothetical protein